MHPYPAQVSGPVDKRPGQSPGLDSNISKACRCTLTDGRSSCRKPEPGNYLPHLGKNSEPWRFQGRELNWIGPKVLHGTLFPMLGTHVDGHVAWHVFSPSSVLELFEKKTEESLGHTRVKGSSLEKPIPMTGSSSIQSLGKCARKFHSQDSAPLRFLFYFWKSGMGMEWVTGRRRLE